MKGEADDFAVVTGAGSGIGRAIAQLLAREGAAVAVADINEANANAVASEIANAGGRAMGFVCDVSDRASVKQLQADVSRTFGPASLLVANAGVAMFERLTDMSEDDVDWIIQVNLFGVLNCLRAFLPDMMKARRGHVVATSSQSALVAGFGPPHAAYVAAKSGVLGLMLALRGELEDFGIGATVVCPGRVATQITDSPRYRPTRFGGPGAAPIALPLGGNHDRFRPPEELAEMVLRAIRANQAVVASDPGHRTMFENGVVALVRAGFDEAVEFDRERTQSPELS